ncbi:MAG: glycosyltransferase [Clostridia bacterium]|nr:glycosyltransferase [Clostridia bacterium]
MSRFEILCVTMHQKDFSKTEQMNIHSDVVFANQCDVTSYDEKEFDGHKARMISTQTRGVGVNRNLALTYATGEICLFADDDVIYRDNVEQIVLSEFDAHPDADVIIFHFDTDSAQRRQRAYPKTRKHGRFERMPWATFRVAIRSSSVKKANIWFTTLFGGGCIFPSGEDSMWLNDAKKKGLTFYVSKETIGTVSFEESTWFTGYNEKFFYGKGAFYCATHSKNIHLWMLYFAWRTRKMSELSCSKKIKWMKYGIDGYRKLLSYDEYISKMENN